MFDQTTKHANSFDVKIPIAFPFLITIIILKQHPAVLHPQETLSKKAGLLTLNKKSFMGIHVPDIMVKHND